MMEFSGVRSSCDMVARKADFNRSADSARSLALANASVRSARSEARRRECALRQAAQQANN